MAFFGRYVVALYLHNMPPKKRKQDDSDAEATDAKPEPEIDKAQMRKTIAFSYISRCTIEELDLVLEAVDRRQDRLLLLAANAFKPGDTVTAGDTVLVLEAMKLLQDLKSPRDATVLEVRHQAGDTVDGGAILITFASRNS